MSVKAAQGCNPLQNAYSVKETNAPTSLASRIYNLFLSFISLFTHCLHKEEETSNDLKEKTLKTQKKAEQLKMEQRRPDPFVERIFGACEERRRKDVVTYIRNASSSVKETVSSLGEVLERVATDVEKLSPNLSSLAFSQEVDCLLSKAKATEVGQKNPGTFDFLANKILPQDHRAEISAIFV